MTPDHKPRRQPGGEPVPEPHTPGFTFGDYLQKIGISERAGSPDGATLNTLVEDAFAEAPPPFTRARVKGLFVYDVPKEENGACMYPKVKETDYNLAHVEGVDPSLQGLENHPATTRLWHLKRIVNRLADATDTEWVGIYRAVTNAAGEPVLAKEAYHGDMSKPEFALTEANALVSNNSRVGLRGEAVIMDDVLGTLAADPNTSYYTCNPNVDSEFCLPIFGKNGDIIGIIDAEAWAKNHFTPDRLLQVAKVAYDLGQNDMGLVA